MRGIVSEYSLETPKSLKEALALLRDHAHTPFAGGTDLMVLLESGILPAGKYLNLLGLKDLQGIAIRPNEIELGATTTYTEIQENITLQKEFPNLAVAARETGAIAIQNRGTIGGNIGNASPAADSPPALLCYDAQLELVSESQTRLVPLESFYLGYKRTLLQKNELIKSVRLPRTFKNWSHHYRKIGTRKMQAISKIVFCATGKHAAGKIVDLRIAFGSVAPITLRCRQTENVVRGNTVTPLLIKKAQEILLSEIQPIDDIRSNRDYRKRVSQNLLAEFLEKFL